MKIKLIHKEWEDEVILNLSNNRLHRLKIENETANFILNKDILHIHWDNWDKEVFIKHNNNYYLCTETDLCHTNWEDICYIDNYNKIIYRKSDNRKGKIEFKEDDQISVEWEEKKSFIPNIIHFVYGFKKQIEEFELYRYLAIISAHRINKPEKIYFHYYYEPYGEWWEKIKPFLTLNKINPPTEIYEKKIYHYAHQADIVRLQQLIKHGGIYLDIDTICLKSFSDLLENDFVMGIQTNINNTQTYGLCNAVIMSQPNSLFAKKWLESYETFRSIGRDQYWDEHSVIKPFYLSKIYPNDIKILNHHSFFYPLWYNIQDILFNENINIEEYKDIILNNYCIHLWDTYSSNYLKTLTENIIFDKNTLYNIFCRKFLRNKISLLFLTYNRYDITKRCLDSYLKCLHQENIEELIILDNNSDDNLGDYLKDFQNKNNKIKLIFSDENIGVCNGRIILFNEAVGDIIISIDSDAYLVDNDFLDKITDLLYDEKYGIVGISGSYIKSWKFGNQEDIDDNDTNEYIVDHIAGCCQAFRRDLFHFNFKLDPFYDKFWVEDTDLSMQSLYLNKINFRINSKKYIEHTWGGSGKNFKDLFIINWEYFSKKWKGKVLNHINE